MNLPSQRTKDGYRMAGLIEQKAGNKTRGSMPKLEHAHIHIRLVEPERGKSYETHLLNLLPASFVEYTYGSVQKNIPKLMDLQG
jgi:hypothetical protein